MASLRNFAMSFNIHEAGNRSSHGSNLVATACLSPPSKRSRYRIKKQWQSKPLPDFSDSDDYQVSVVLNGEVGDENFLRFLEAVGRETMSSFATEHLLLLDLIHREQEVPERLKPSLRALVDTGVVETVGRGRGVRYLLSRRFYRFTGSPGAYSRRRGLDRNTSKMLLLRHIQSASRRGCSLAELQDVLPGLSRSQVQGLLRELRSDGDIHVVGRTRAARWRVDTA